MLEACGVSESAFFTSGKRVGCFYMFGESVLSTAKHIGGLRRVGECVLTNAKRVVDL